MTGRADDRGIRPSRDRNHEHRDSGGLVEVDTVALVCWRDRLAATRSLAAIRDFFWEHDDVESKFQMCQIAAVLRSRTDAGRLHDADSRVASSTCISVRLRRRLNALLRDR